MRIKQTRRRLAAAAITPVVVLALAACNGDDDDSSGSKKESTSQTSSQEPSTAASTDATPSTATEESDPTPAQSGDLEPKEFTDLVAAGLEKSTSAKFTMKMTAQGMTIDATGALDYSQKQPATQMKMKMGQMGDMEAIMVDDAMYMKLPAAGGAGAGKWMKMSLKDALGGAAGGNLGALDMRKSLQAFTQGVKSVTNKGSESINGVDTTHYLVVANVEALNNMLGTGDTAQLPKTMTYDVWLDGDGRFTKMNADLKGAGTMEMNLTDWGTPVSIKAPPANQVTEMPATGR
ncbi:LppX_LprAFG lipoprotein [Nocardioides sp. Bht2]|uniref:LppX_LprAFG lipoprotein n=1 Tax=Nocardioides sp. Bht2 TaxID=3392297 RepID=UPI0039B63283